MKNYINYILNFFFVLFLLVLFGVSNHKIFASSTGIVNATVQLAVCGDNVKDYGEQCDSSNLGGKSCLDLGFDGGTLGCSFACEYDTTGCTTNATVHADVILSPSALRTYILPDGMNSLNIDIPEAFYSSDLHLFLFSHDGSDFNLTKPIPSGQNLASKLYGLIFADENGDVVSKLSKSSEITLSYAGTDLNTIDENTLAPYRNEEGSSLWTAIPNYTQNKNYKTFSFATDEFSYFTILGSSVNGNNNSNNNGNNNGNNTVGGSNNYLPKATPEEKKKILKVADFSKDGRVDIADLSILLYYFDKTGPSIAKYDLNSDGKVDLIDVSIMLYYWSITS